MFNPAVKLENDLFIDAGMWKLPAVQEVALQKLVELAHKSPRFGTSVSYFPECHLLRIRGVDPFLHRKMATILHMIVGGNYSRYFSITARASKAITLGEPNGSSIRPIQPNDPTILLKRLGSFIPRKHRESIVGDLSQDIAEYREDCWTEKHIRRHLAWQFSIILFERFKGVFRWVSCVLGFKRLIGWVVGKFNTG